MDFETDRNIMKILRSSKVKLNYSNMRKLENLFIWMKEGTSILITNKINELIYSKEEVPSLLKKSFTSSLPYSQRINQLISKEISSCARSIKNKIKKAEKERINQKYQQEIYDKYINKTLNIKWLGNLNLDNRFVSIEIKNKSKEFDYWINIKYPRMPRVYIPIKETKHMKSLVQRGYKLKTNSIKICKNNEIILFFYKEKEIDNTNQEVIGIDIGRDKAFVTSRNERSNEEIKNLLNSLKNQKHGSENKESRIRKMKQVIDLSVKNDIDWSNLKHIYLEDLTGLKNGFRRGNINLHWSYEYIQNRIMLLSEELDVQVKQVTAAYTSQTCSSCKFSHKNNRNKELFLCTNCGYEADADYNAAVNIHDRGTNNAHGQKT